MEDIITGIRLGNMFLATEIVGQSTVGCADGGGGGQGATVGTCIAFTSLI
jgi:hypothetical protein